MKNIFATIMPLLLLLLLIVIIMLPQSHLHQLVIIAVVSCPGVEEED
jgi:hypothetical protein